MNRLLTACLLASFLSSAPTIFAQSGIAKPSQPTSRPPATPPGAGTGNSAPSQNGQNPNAAPQQRPTPNLMRVQPLDPALKAVLQEWEMRSAQIKSLEGRHWRYVYNDVFCTETRGIGYFYYTAPDQGRIDLKGATIPAGAVAKRIDPQSKKPYAIEPELPQKWVCDGKRILFISDKEKNYETIPLPDDLQGQNIIHGPLPFLFGMKVEEAQRRYKMTLLAEDKTQAKILAEPLLPHDRANYKEATVLLDKGKYLPNAVQLVDPAGTTTTVYVFEDLKPKLFTDKGTFMSTLFPEKNPFQPDLKGYQIVQSASPQTPGAEIRQTNGTKDSEAVPRVPGSTRPSQSPGTGSGPSSNAAPPPGKTALNPGSSIPR